MNTPATDIYSKLDSFRKKYYRNELLRGGLLFLALFVSALLLVSLTEFFGYFGTATRTAMFYTFLLLTLSVFGWFIARPVLKLFRFAKGIDYEEAARIIGLHFAEVSDTLLNVLQLSRNARETGAASSLLVAAIEQKTIQLSPVPFQLAVRFKSSLRYLKYALPPLVILLVLLSANPSVITNPAQRIINYSTFYEKPAPFQFEINNKKLETLQLSDFVLDVATSGQMLPEQLWLVIGPNEFLMQKQAKNKFSYLFRTPRQDIRFHLKADNYQSREYVLKVLPKPLVTSFSIELDYPAYTRKASEMLENTGDITVPEGTRINWSYNTSNTDRLILQLGADTFHAQARKNLFQFRLTAKSTSAYSILPSNRFISAGDSLQYLLNVIPDAFPSIAVDEYKDSTDNRRLYFNGMIKDDYGFSKMYFRYRFVNQKDQAEKTESNAIPVSTSDNAQSFYYFFDLSSVLVQPGEELVYYFEVFDNDGVNGHKSARSSYFYYKAPDEKELKELSKQQSQDIENLMTSSINTARQLQKQIEDINRKLVEKNVLNWEDRQQVKDLLKKQQELEKAVEEIKATNQDKSKTDQHFKEFTPEMLEKQKQLEKLFDELMTEEMKEMFRQLEQMIDQVDKNQLQEMMEKMKLSNEDIEKELDRNLQLFKQLEFDKKLTDAIESIDKLKERQDDLRKEMDNSKSITDEQIKEQENLKQDFDQLQKELEELKKLNESLEDSKNMPETEKREESIQQNMEKSSKSMKQGRKKEASGAQKEASDEMDELKEELESFQQEMDEEQSTEDIATLRKILDNLIRVSFRQEGLMKQFSTTSRQDPGFIGLIEKQKGIASDLKIVEDSLFALSKRQLQLESFVNREINEINFNADKALKALIDMNTVGMVAGNSVGESQMRQQNVMTSVNNLALMLAESLKQMQQQSNNQKKSGQNCKNSKPGKSGKPSKPSAATMRKMQEQLNQQMQQMKEQMEKGGKPQRGQPSMSEQFARMAAQQEAIRKMMQEYRDQLMKEGMGDKGNMSKLMQEMEKTESDLVNKILSQETLKRQQDILIRLLDSEKAERERELDEKRESTESKNAYFSNPKEFLEYKRIKAKEEELIRSVPPDLKPFYKNKVNEYFYKLDE